MTLTEKQIKQIARAEGMDLIGDIIISIFIIAFGIAMMTLSGAVFSYIEVEIVERSWWLVISTVFCMFGGLIVAMGGALYVPVFRNK